MEPLQGKTLKDIQQFQEDCRDELQERLQRFSERLDEAQEEFLETSLGPNEDEED